MGEGVRVGHQLGSLSRYPRSFATANAINY